MPKGVLLAFLTYALFSTADAFIKHVGARLPVTEIVFLATLFNIVVIAFLRPPGERWRDMFRMRHPWLIALRSACGVVAGLAGTYAFTTISFAETYALIFLAPVLVTLLSIPLLGEPVGWRRLSAVAAGFIGMLLVVKPGFRELEDGHLAALLVAFVGAASMIVLRKIGHSERRVSLVGVVMIVSVIASGILSISVFVWPTWDTLWPLLLVGVFGGIGQLTILAATRNAPANRVAPAQYSQIVWAVVFGALFFEEFPDWIALAGIALIGLSGLFTLLREDKVSGWSRRTVLVGDKP